MNRNFYQNMTQPFRDFPKLAKSVHRTNQILTFLVAGLYAGLLFFLCVQHPDLLYKTILVPLGGFFGVSVLRVIVNRKRPYEVFGISPIIPKDTKGKSFPSRHVYSATILAVTFLAQGETCFVGIGVGMMIAAFVIATLRVISGVHYVSDVIAGFILALLTGWLGFVVI